VNTCFFTEVDLTMKRFFFFAALALAVLFSAGAKADANFRMRVESGTSTGPGVVLTADGTSGFNSGTIPASSYSTISDQFIQYSGPITSQFNIQSTTGTSTPTLAAPGYYEALDLNNMTVNATGAGVLRLILEKDNLGSATPNGGLEFRSSVGGTFVAPAGSTVTFESYADDASGVPLLGLDKFPTGTLASVTGIGAGSPAKITQTFAADSPGNFGSTNSVGFTKSGGYSIYTVVTISFTGAGSISFDQTVGTAPAPGGLLLLASGVPVLALGWLRRRKTKNG